MEQKQGKESKKQKEEESKREEQQPEEIIQKSFSYQESEIDDVKKTQGILPVRFHFYNIIIINVRIDIFYRQLKIKFQKVKINQI